MKSLLLSFVALALLGLPSGCSKQSANVGQSVAYDGSRFVLSTEPADAQDVIAIRQSAQDADDVVIVGRIGGALNPWVEGRAAFQIVDPSIPACSDAKVDGEPCSCKTPWDYCCETDKLPDAMALVQFVEPDGTVVKQDARKVFGLKELQTVIVRGKAKRDDAGNLTILAEEMYVRN